MQCLTQGDGVVVDYLIELVALHPPVEAALRVLAGVEAVTQPEDGKPHYRVRFHTEKATPNDLVRAVLEHGGVLVGLRRDARHLNEAFMDLTRPGVAPSTAEGAV